MVTGVSGSGRTARRRRTKRRPAATDHVVDEDLDVDLVNAVSMVCFIFEARLLRYIVPDVVCHDARAEASQRHFNENSQAEAMATEFQKVRPKVKSRCVVECPEITGRPVAVELLFFSEQIGINTETKPSC